MNLKSSTINLVETYLNIIIKRKLNQSSLSIAAKSFLVAAVAAISAPSFVDLAIAIIHLLSNKTGSINAAVGATAEDSFHIYAFFILIFISIIFFTLSYFYSKTKNDDIVQIKSIVGEFKVNNSIISCYVGNILNIYEADVVVTSEDTGLDIGSITGTSVSGRLRRMASSRDTSGDIASDNLKNFIDSWKSSRGKYANFELGTSVVCEDSFEAKRHNIKSIILAVAIRKKEDNTAEIEESAISKIVCDALTETVRQGYRSIFIPIFGLGSGRIPSSRAVSFTVNAVKTHLPKFNEEIRLYLGVYREEDKVDLLLKLRAMQREI